MGIAVTQFESTPNPNAVKCLLDRDLPGSSGSPRSYRDAQAAQVDPIASAIFGSAGPGEITGVLLATDWLTVNKSPQADWKRVRAAIKAVLARVGERANGEPA